MDFLSTEENNHTVTTTLEPKKQRSLLRRLSSNLSLLSFRSDDDDASLVDEAQRQLQPKRRPPAFGSLSVPRWTPPLSPSRSRSSTRYKENRQHLQSPQDALLVLRSPGVPALSDLREIKELVGAASRPWLRDFLIRGGRRCVNAKVSEMAALEKEVKKRPVRVGLGRVFGRTTYGARNMNGKGGLQARPTLREIAEVREELMQLVLFLHLRE